MADIELVIKIPEKLYNRIKYLEPKADTMLDELMRSIQSGTPLPEHHGRLIDADALIQELSVVSSRPIKSQLYMLKEASTIIEADRGE